jgi:hypothetical protein
MIKARWWWRVRWFVNRVREAYGLKGVQGLRGCYAWYVTCRIIWFELSSVGVR